MNFLKRAGAIFMLLAIFASSCNKYADDFTQVNTKLDAIASSVAGLSTLSTDMSAVKSQITALQTAIAALPSATVQAGQFAAVTAQLTTMSTAIASLDTQIKAVATSGTATKAVVDKLATDLKTLSDKVTADNAKILLGQTDATTKLSAMDVKVTGLDTKMTAMTATMVTLAAAVAQVQTGVDGNKVDIAANKADIAALAVKLTDQATAIAKIGTDLAANTSADAAAVIADAAANASLMASMATLSTDLATVKAAVALAAQTGTSTDAATALTIQGLQLLLNAQKAQLDVILANTNVKVTDVTITGSALVGGTLTANPVPASATVTYQWQSATTSTGTYADVAGATNATYVVVAGDLTKFFKVKIVGTGNYLSPTSLATSLPTAAVGAQIPVTGVTVAGTVQVGATLTATVTPTVASGATVTFQWESSTSATGTYVAIAGATKETYKLTSAEAGMYVQVHVIGTGGYTGDVTNVTPSGPVLFTDVNSPAFTLISANNTVTITATGGTFKTTTGGLLKAQFTFVGVDAATLTSGTFKRVDDTHVTFSTTSATGFGKVSSNYVTISNAAMATQVASAVAVPSTEVISSVVSGGAVAITAPVAGAIPQTTVTVVGSGWTAGTITWSPADATFLNGTAYTASFTATPAAGYTLTGATADWITVTGATGGQTGTKFVLADKGAVKAVFSSTALTPITLLAIPGVSAPVPGAGPVTSITTAQYTATISWNTSPVTFLGNVTYTATIAITPAAGYTVVGVGTNAFTVAGATATNAVNSGAVSALFPITPAVPVNVPAVSLVSIPVKAALDASSISSTLYTGSVSWSPALVGGTTFAANTVYTATVTLTAGANYTFTGLPANYFTVAGGTATSAINSGTITVVFPATAL